MSDDFTRHVIRVIVARVAEGCNFTTVSESALEILVDAVIERLSDYASTAGRIAAQGGRTQSNIYDVLTALSRYDESMETLTEFHQSSYIPQFEFLVEPYPLPRFPKFYASQASNNTQAHGAPTPPSITLPFRANTTLTHVQMQNGVPVKDKHIPQFFPNFPNMYTYDQTPARNDHLCDDKEAAMKRETDMRQMKGALKHILPRNTDQPHETNLNSELATLEGSHLISVPTNLLEAPGYMLTGVRCPDDPEFLPMIPVTDELGGETSNRDSGMMRTILSIRHGTAEPGGLKNATYTGSSVNIDREQERPDSPPSP